MNSYHIKQSAHLLLWRWAQAFKQNPDRNITLFFQGALFIMALAFVLSASVKAPKQIKFSLLLSGALASVAWLQYEREPSTKRLRMVEMMRARTQVSHIASHLQREEQLQQAQAYVQTGEDVEQVLQHVADPGKRQQYAEVLGAEYGTPVAQPMQAPMGAMADADPYTLEVESRQAFEMKVAPPSKGTAQRPKTELESYLGDINRRYTQKSGGDGTLSLHLAMEGRTRSGKSLLAEVLLHSRLRDGIERNYRVVPLVLSAHRRSDGPFKVQFCNVPDLAKVPTSFQPGFVYVDPEDYPTALSEAITLLENEFKVRKHNGAEWGPNASQTPLFMLIVDEVQDLVQQLGKSAALDIRERLGVLLRGGSKYGLAWWMIGHDFVESRSEVFNVAMLKNCTHLVGFDELKTNVRLSGTGAQDAMHQMTVNSQNAKPTGLYSPSLGYLSPAPLKTVKQLAFDWSIDEEELREQRLSMINSVRQMIGNMSMDAGTIKDEMLLLLCEECSNFSGAEIKEWVGQIRAFLAMPDADYQQYLDDLKAIADD